MTSQPTTLALAGLALLSAVLLALLCAVAAALLARADGASPAGCMTQAAVAFASTLTLISALLAVVVSAWR